MKTLILLLALATIAASTRAEIRPDVHIVAQADERSFGIPWNLNRPTLTVPLREGQISYKAVLTATVKKVQGTRFPLGGQVVIQKGKESWTVPKVWPQLLNQVATVPLRNRDFLYLVLVQGNRWETRSDVLVDPKTHEIFFTESSFGEGEPTSATHAMSRNLTDPANADIKTFLVPADEPSSAP
jgi:hypothetical protein